MAKVVVSDSGRDVVVGEEVQVDLQIPVENEFARIGSYSMYFDEEGSPLKLTRDGTLVKLWNFGSLHAALADVEDRLVRLEESGVLPSQQQSLNSTTTHDKSFPSPAMGVSDGVLVRDHSASPTTSEGTTS